MDNKTKIILSVIGISAVVIPLGLLMFLSSKPQSTQLVQNGSRKIDADAVNQVVQSNLPKATYATPGPSSPSARPLPEGTNSAF